MTEIATSAYETPQHPSQEEFVAEIGKTVLQFDPSEALPRSVQKSELTTPLPQNARNRVIQAIDTQPPRR